MLIIVNIIRHIYDTNDQTVLSEEHSDVQQNVSFLITGKKINPTFRKSIIIMKFVA